MSATQIRASAGDTTQTRLTRVIDTLDMSEKRREWMRDRWLDQVLWFDRRALHANRRYSALRIVAISGGVVVPALVSMSQGGGDPWIRDWATPAAFVVSILVAISVGLDSFFHFGERWRHFRRTAELLKNEGWLFIEGGGRYKRYQHISSFHDKAFPLFATKVEELVRRDVEVYLTRIVQEKQEDSDKEDQEVGTYLDAKKEGDHSQEPSG
jgi:Protein of unknown function (DUF4231)